MEAWDGSHSDDTPDTQAEVPAGIGHYSAVGQKLETIGRGRWVDGGKSHPEFTFDRTLLSSRDPLTDAEIDYVNLQIGDAVRKLAVQYGCEPKDVEKLEARYWFEKQCSYQNGNHVWGIFFDCDQSNYDERRSADERAPGMIREFLREFQRGMDAICSEESNTVPIEGGGRRCVGWTHGDWNNHAFMRGSSREVVLPIVTLIQQFDPAFTLRFDVPQEHRSDYESISDRDLNSMVHAPESCFWIDKSWAQGELDKRAAGQEWRDMQDRIDRSRITAKAEEQAPPQSLRERLKLAFSGQRIAPVEPHVPHSVERGR